jgi:hypothetical protein
MTLGCVKLLLLSNHQASDFSSLVYAAFALCLANLGAYMLPNRLKVLTHQ